MTTTRFITGVVVGEHRYIFRWDSTHKSLFGVFSRVLSYWLDGTFTLEQWHAVRTAVCQEVESVR